MVTLSQRNTAHPGIYGYTAELHVKISRSHQAETPKYALCYWPTYGHDIPLIVELLGGSHNVSGPSVLFCVCWRKPIAARFFRGIHFVDELCWKTLKATLGMAPWDITIISLVWRAGVIQPAYVRYMYCLPLYLARKSRVSVERFRFRVLSKVY